MDTFRRLRLDSFLSFAPGSEAFDLRALNVLIGPNGSGKSNVIEAFELLRSTPTDLAGTIRDGGGPAEWIWKGGGRASGATLDVEVTAKTPSDPALRYLLEFTAVQIRSEILDEAIEEVASDLERSPFYYRFNRGNPEISIRSTRSPGKRSVRRLLRKNIAPDQSILAQRKDPEHLPELNWLGELFGGIVTFREWTFGRYAPLRQPQPADLPNDTLLPDARNLGLVLSQIEHTNGSRFNHLLKRFYPRFERISTPVSGGTVQFYLHERGIVSPISAMRLSDGTLRFLALLAALLSPTPPTLLWIEEPELGLHPDAVALIADVLVEASERMQLVVTTHSDTLVSALSNQPEAVIACERPGAGTTLRRLDSKKLRTWLDEYQLGDLWRIGQLGANP